MTQSSIKGRDGLIDPNIVVDRIDANADIAIRSIVVQQDQYVVSKL